MSKFKDRAEFEDVMQRLFDRIMLAPGVAGPLSDTGLVVRFRYPDIDSVLTFDFHDKPAVFSTRGEGEADVGMLENLAMHQAAHAERRPVARPADRQQTETVLPVTADGPVLQVVSGVFDGSYALVADESKE